MVSIVSGSKNRALTLAEVMLSVGLLGVVVLVVMGVYIAGIRSMERSEVRTEATNLGADLLEIVDEQGGFGALPDSDLTFDGSVPDSTLDGFPPPPYPGTERYSLKVRTRVVSARTRALMVEVQWAQGAVKLERVYHEAR